MKTSKNDGKFSLDRFNDERSVGPADLAVTAALSEDGDYFVLDLNPCAGNRRYRIHQSAVHVGPVERVVRCAGGEEHELRHVVVRRDAVCVLLQKSTAELLLDPVARSRAFEAIETATLRVEIAFRSNGEGSFSYAGKTVNCLGEAGENYPNDLTIQGVEGVDKFPRKFSNEYQVWMDWAVLIVGQKGIYIHEGAATIPGNGGSDSAGCIHLEGATAKEFYDWVTGRTRITISYPW